MNIPIGNIRNFTYTEKDYKLLIELIKASNSLFPGGLIVEKEITLEKVKKFIEKFNATSTVVFEENNQIKGLLILAPSSIDPKVGFISLVFVHPSEQGKGYGKQLILYAVSYAKDYGWDRLDLETWAGNTKAVPLYKKAGFVWVPGTDVYMENYLPLILRETLLQYYIKTLDDWYSCITQNIDQSPNNTYWKNTLVYEYSFTIQQGSLKIYIHPTTHAIYGIETPDFTFWVETKPSTTIFGLPFELSFNCKNHQKTSEIIKLDYKLPNSIIGSTESKNIENIPANSTFSFKKKFHFPITNTLKTEHVIRIKITTNSYPIMLEYPLVITPGIIIQPHPKYLRFPAGYQGHLYLDIINHFDQPVTININNDQKSEIEILSSMSLYLDSNSHLPYQVQIKTPTNPINNPSLIHLFVDVNYQNQLFQFPQPPIPAIITTPNTLASYQRDDEYIIENPTFRIILDLKKSGSIKEIQSVDHSLIYLRKGVIDNVGPPYQPNTMRNCRAEVSTIETPNTLQITTVISPQNRKIQLKRIYTLHLGKPIISIQHIIKNLDTSKTIFSHLQTGFHWPSNITKIRYPSNNSCLEYSPTSFAIPLHQDDFPSEKKDFSETWIAYQHSPINYTSGIIWHKTLFSKMQIRGPGINEGDRLEFSIPPISAKSEITLPSIYLYHGPGDWNVIRSTWQELINCQPAFELTKSPLSTKTPLNVMFEDPIISPHTNPHQEKTICIENIRNTLIEGTLEIESPSMKPILIENLQIPPKTTIRIKNQNIRTTVKDLPKIIPYKFNFRSRVRKYEFQDYLIFTGILKDKIQISKTETNRDVWNLRNSFFNLQCSQSHHGGIIFFGTKKTENLLQSSYPNPIPRIIMNPWYGGIHTFINTKKVFIGNLWKEQFTFKKYSKRKWQGIQAKTIIKQPNSMYHNLQLFTRYMTQPGSNILLIQQEVIPSQNQIGTLDLGLYFQPTEISNLYYREIGKDLFSVYTPKENTFALSPIYQGCIMQSEKTKQYLVFKNIPNSKTETKSRIGFFHLPDFGGFTFSITQIPINPQKKVTQLYAIIIDPENLEESKDYLRVNTNFGFRDSP